MRLLLAIALVLGLLSPGIARPVRPHAPATTFVWTGVYAATPAGGIVQGNPQAPVKLVEYYSPSCPHCKHFIDDARVGLSTMIVSGKLSYETRPLLLPHPHDPALDVLIRCGTPQQGAALTEAFFAEQDNIYARLEPVFKANVARWKALTITAAYTDIADKLGLVALAQQAGVSLSRAQACLGDKRNYDALQAISNTANQLKVDQTPSFFLNGAALPTTPTEAPWVSVKRVLDVTLSGVTWPPKSSQKKGSS